MKLSSVAAKFTKPDLVGRINRRLLRYGGLHIGAGYDESYGWQLSRKKGQPVDGNGNPIPYITYPAFAVLKRVVLPHYRVFEYGCGNSSLWWAANVKSVVSVEHSNEWADAVASRAPENLKVVRRPLQAGEQASELVSQFFKKFPVIPQSGHRDIDIEHGMLLDGFLDYASEITSHASPFDIIIVDGMARSLCAWMAAHHLAADGFIVFDNSDRWQYNPGYEALYDLGFGRVDFWGPGLVNHGEWCTSIFYRNAVWSKPLITLDPNIRTGIDWQIDSANRKLA
jgi:hypothetical protein